MTTDLLRRAAHRLRLEGGEFNEAVAEMMDGVAIRLACHRITAGSPGVHSAIKAAAAYLGETPT